MNDQFEQPTTAETEQTTAEETPTAKLLWTTPVPPTVEVEDTEAGKSGFPVEVTSVQGPLS